MDYFFEQGRKTVTAGDLRVEVLHWSEIHLPSQRKGFDDETAGVAAGSEASELALPHNGMKQQEWLECEPMMLVEVGLPQPSGGYS